MHVLLLFLFCIFMVLYIATYLSNFTVLNPARGRGLFLWGAILCLFFLGHSFK